MTHFAQLALLTIAILHPSTTWARVWTVEADGSGDAPTIQAAVDSSETFDVIELGDGIFLGQGNRDVNAGGKALTFQSRSAAEDCIIDCEGTPGENHRGFIIQERCEFRGLTIRNGYTSDQGGAILAIAGQGVDIYDCVFINNTAVYGGALSITFNTRTRGVTEVGNSIEVHKSIFLRNHAEDTAGAVYAAFFIVDFVGCQFIENTAVRLGGGISFARSDVEFTRCLFVKNQAERGGAVHVDQWEARMWWCTFVGNRASEGGGAHIVATATDGGASLYNCILAFGAGGGSVACRWDNNFGLSCCDVFGNEGGDWVPCNFTGEEAGENIGRENFSSDPLFCSMQGNEYTLSSNSPCAAENNSCGLIGAFDVGCGPTATESRSWGSIKSLYR